MPLEVWERLVDEIAAKKQPIICIRSGEPFLYPGILELLLHIKKSGLFVSMDTNGTLLGKYAKAVADLKIDRLIVSIDGPEEIHDEVRGAEGSFRKTAEGIRKIKDLETKAGRKSCVQTICFVISPHSLKGLAQMPDVARSLEIPEIAVVPYYYLDDEAGQRHEEIMKRGLGCRAPAWRGFNRKTSGVDTAEFLEEYRNFKSNLGNIRLVPFMPFSEEDYSNWFGDCVSPAGKSGCSNPWKLLDIQPDGEANFCVDFPDYSLGNVTKNTIEELWNNKRADRFREYLSKQPLPACARCGAKYMS